MCAGIEYKDQVESSEFTGIECCNEDVAVQLPSYSQRRGDTGDHYSNYILKSISFPECLWFAPSTFLFNLNFRRKNAYLKRGLKHLGLKINLKLNVLICSSCIAW